MFREFLGGVFQVRDQRRPAGGRVGAGWLDARHRVEAPGPQPHSIGYGLIDAGAKFLVSPICGPELAFAMVASGLAVMVGALTPTEVEQAIRLGSDVVKIFTGSLVGPGYIKALKGPFPYIPLMPTGGVSIENVGDWFGRTRCAVIRPE